jgi:hypothetical protein
VIVDTEVGPGVFDCVLEAQDHSTGHEAAVHKVLPVGATLGILEGCPIPCNVEGAVFQGLFLRLANYEGILASAAVAVDAAVAEYPNTNLDIR